MLRATGVCANGKRVRSREQASTSLVRSSTASDDTGSTSSTSTSTCSQRRHHRDQLVRTATLFYERAWSLPSPRDADLEPFLTEDHVQRDMVWQAGRESVGRAAMAKGMRHMRRAVYPDLAFSVDRASVVAEGSGRDSVVFLEWTFRGTFEGRADVARGVTVFDFEEEGPSSPSPASSSPASSSSSASSAPPRIARSSVYRQALPAEVDLARRTKGEVAEGVLLEQKGGKSE